MARRRKRKEGRGESDGEKKDSFTPGSKNIRVRRAGAEEAEEREGCGHCAPPPAQAGVGWGGPWGNVRSCPPAALSPYFASLRPAAASAPLRTRQAAAEARGRKKKWLYKGTKGGNRPRQLRGEGRVGGGSGSAYVPGATRNILSG